MNLTGITGYLKRKSKTFLLALGLTADLGVGFVDYVTGCDYELAIFYLIPIFLSTWFITRKAGIGMSVVSTATMYFSDHMPEKAPQCSSPELWDLSMHLSFFIVLVLLLSKLRSELDRRTDLISELRSALDTVKKLSGLLPICSSCKKIRDKKGDWNQLESYIHEHSEADFSHGLCPECAKRLYPQVYKGDS